MLWMRCCQAERSGFSAGKPPPAGSDSWYKITGAASASPVGSACSSRFSRPRSLAKAPGWGREPRLRGFSAGRSAAREPEGEAVKTGTETRGASILVVDDDASLASTLKEFLTREGYSVEVARSAAEALSIQQANPGISLALVDLIMPVTDGLTLTDELRRRDPGLSVIIMTGYGTIETAVDAIKRGAEDYVTKPFDYEAVRKKIARLTEVIELRERVAQLEKNLERHPCFENIDRKGVV